jgi:WD40 repeat protein
MQKPVLFAVILLFFLLAACTPNQQPAPIPTQPVIPTLTETPTATLSPTPTATVTPIPSPTSSPELILSQASQTCEAAFGKRPTGGEIQPGIMSILKQGETWSYYPLLPSIVEAHTPDDIKNIYCLWEYEKTVEQYTDNQPAIQYEWFVSLVTYPQGNVIAAYSYLLGDYPPETKPANGLPGYGTRPESAAVDWLLSKQMKLFFSINLGPEFDQLVFLPDGNTMLVAGNYSSIISLNTGENNSSRTFYEAWNTPLAIALAPDGQKLAVASFGKAKILDIASGKVALELVSAPESTLVLRLAYSPDGSRLAGADTRSIIIWDTNTGALLQTLKPPQELRVENVTYSHDGHLLAANCSEKVYVWETGSGTLIATLEAPFSSKWISFTLDNQHLVYDSFDNSSATYKVVLVDTSTWMISQSFPGYSLHAISPDGKLLALALEKPATPEDRQILLVDLASGSSSSLPDYATQPVYLTFTPTSQTLAVRSQDGFVYFYDLSVVSK